MLLFFFFLIHELLQLMIFELDFVTSPQSHIPPVRSDTAAMGHSTRISGGVYFSAAKKKTT